MHFVESWCYGSNELFVVGGIFCPAGAILASPLPPFCLIYTTSQFGLWHTLPFLLPAKQHLERIVFLGKGVIIPAFSYFPPSSKVPYSERLSTLSPSISCFLSANLCCKAVLGNGSEPFGYGSWLKMCNYSLKKHISVQLKKHFEVDCGHFKEQVKFKSWAESSVFVWKHAGM